VLQGHFKNFDVLFDVYLRPTTVHAAEQNQRLKIRTSDLLLEAKAEEGQIARTWRVNLYVCLYV